MQVSFRNQAMATDEKRKLYWKENLTVVSVLLSIWFLCSFGCAILFVDELDKIQIAGFKLGFWMAQQGSLYIFVLIIFAYVWMMNRIDKKHDVHED